MKTKIKTARERAEELMRNIGLSELFYPATYALVAKAFDNHARRAHERHARKNVCFVGHEVVEMSGGFDVTRGMEVTNVTLRKRK